jgi:hypothetical protein
VTEANGVAVPDTTGDSVAVPLVVGDTMATVGGPTAVKLVVAVEQPTDVQAVAVSVVEPGETLTAQLQEPAGVAVVLHKVAPVGSVRVTILPGVAVPDTVGEVVAVVLLGPVTATVGGLLGGATVNGLEAVDTPSVAVTLCGPAVNVRLVHCHWPFVPAMVTQGPPEEPGPPVTVTLLPGAAVPEMGGFRLATVVPLGGPVMTTGSLQTLT